MVRQRKRQARTMVRKCNVSMRTTPALKREIDRLMRELNITRDEACDILARKVKTMERDDDIQRLFF